MKKRVFKLSLTDVSANLAIIHALEDYQASLKQKETELSERIADIGLSYAGIWFDEAIYKGPMTGASIDVEDRGDGKFAIVANGEVFVIIEFGAGVTYGYGHPQAEEFGLGPGTYPGQTHAMTGKGWHLPKSAGGGHTYGNPPSKTMYKTAKALREELVDIAREVFTE